jgi:hypothetical protein
MTHHGYKRSQERHAIATSTRKDKAELANCMRDYNVTNVVI